MPVVHARVRRALARRGLPFDDHPDLAQEVWLSLLDDDGRVLRNYDPARGATLEGYVGMVSEREIGNRLQKLRAKKRGAAINAEGVDVDDQPSRNAGPESVVATAELAQRLGEHLESVLPPRGQLIFRYAFTDGLPPERIAQILSIEVQVVYNWQHRIRKTVREFLESDAPRAARP
jgi:RNA polymerase sigma-70 factor (ECF subfamily)